MIIYKITNIINNKIYIGKTEKSLNKRWSGHIAKSRKNIISVLHNAILKYGKENFKIERV